MTDKADEGGQGVEGEKGHPETVPWDKYVGVKEMLTKAEAKVAKVENELKGKVTNLEEQLKKAVSADEVTKVQEQLKEAQEAAKKAQDDLKKLMDASLSEKRAALIQKGIPEADVKDMSEKELAALAKVVAGLKPKADMSSGGGGVPITGSPMELARQAYSQSKSK